MLDHLTDVGVLRIVVVLRPGIESPVDQLQHAIGAINHRWSRIAQPDAIVGRDVQSILVRSIRNAVRSDQLPSAVSDRLVVTENLDALEFAQRAHYLGVN